MAVVTKPAPVVREVTPLFGMGRMFIGPVFDSLVIGGGLSLIAGVLLWGLDIGRGVSAAALIPVLVIANHAHFAASTVRLYTRPGPRRVSPLVTLALPVAALAVTTAAIVAPEPAGLLLFATSIIWSPYHYSAQAYGLSVMYAYRSGVDVGAPEKRRLRGVCLLPFLWTVLQPEGGVAMVLRYAGMLPVPGLELARSGGSAVLTTLTLIAPLFLFMRLRRRAGITLPMISLLVIASNAVWWTLFNYLDAFVWATVFHGVQYLAIVMVFHVKDRLRHAGNTRSWRFHAATFYATCVGLGYVLFALWPWAHGLVGLNAEKSALLTTATINIHHFIVDAFIWRLRKDPNYRNVVEETAPALA